MTQPLLAAGRPGSPEDSLGARPKTPGCRAAGAGWSGEWGSGESLPRAAGGAGRRPGPGRAPSSPSAALGPAAASRGAARVAQVEAGAGAGATGLGFQPAQARPQPRAPAGGPGGRRRRSGAGPARRGPRLQHRAPLPAGELRGCARASLGAVGAPRPGAEAWRPELGAGRRPRRGPGRGAGHTAAVAAAADP